MSCSCFETCPFVVLGWGSGIRLGQVSQRPSASQLLAHPYFAPLHAPAAAPSSASAVTAIGHGGGWGARWIPSASLRAWQLPPSPLVPVTPLLPPPTIAVSPASARVPPDPLTSLAGWSWDELYYLWSKAGGDLQGELIRLGVFSVASAIDLLPVLCRTVDEESGKDAPADPDASPEKEPALLDSAASLLYSTALHVLSPVPAALPSILTHLCAEAGSGSGADAADKKVGGKDATSTHVAQLAATYATRVAAASETTTVHRYDPIIYAVSLRWLLPFLHVDPARVLIDASDALMGHAPPPSDTTQMSNEELFRHTVARLRRLRQLLPLYPASREDIVAITLPVASVLATAEPLDLHVIDARFVAPTTVLQTVATVFANANAPRCGWGQELCLRGSGSISRRLCVHPPCEPCV